MNLNEARFVCNPDVIFREDFDDNAILFDSSTDKAFAINAMGALVWKALASKRTLKDITEIVRRDYENIPDNLEEDIKKFINQLIERGLVGCLANT